MLGLLASSIFQLVATSHRYLARHGLTNLLVRRVLSSPPRWRTALALGSATGLLAVFAGALEVLISEGGPHWLYVLILVVVWDAIKLATCAALTSARAVTLTAGGERSGSRDQN